MGKVAKRPASEAIVDGYYRFNLPKDPNPQEVDRLLSLLRGSIRKHAEASPESSVRESVLQWLSR